MKDRLPALEDMETILLEWRFGNHSSESMSKAFRGAFRNAPVRAKTNKPDGGSLRLGIFPGSRRLLIISRRLPWALSLR